MKRILLAAAAVADNNVATPRIKWLHVATEGSFDGHRDGQFTLDADVFRSFVDNLHAHPQFHVGADGWGDRPTIPFDYEHASELSATEGSIPVTGAPAPAWVLDVDVRRGPDGSSELWALAQLGLRLRQQIDADEYKFTSIAFTLDGSDPMTGESIGPALSSIAVTNHPFLRNLRPLQIAASSRGRGKPRVLFAEPVSSGADAEREHLPRDLSKSPVDLDDLDSVCEFLRECSTLDDLDEDALREYASACVELTRQKKAERADPEPLQDFVDDDQLERKTSMAGRNPLNLTEAELAICDRAPDAFAAAVQILGARDPKYKANPHLFRPKTYDFAEQLALWAAGLEESTQATARNAALRAVDLDGEEGRNPIERMISLLERKRGAAFRNLELRSKIREASDELTLRGMALQDPEETDEETSDDGDEHTLSTSAERAVAPPRAPVGPGWPPPSITLEELRDYPPARPYASAPALQNDVGCAITYMQSIQPAFASFPWDFKVRRAADLVRSLQPFGGR